MEGIPHGIRTIKYLGFEVWCILFKLFGYSQEFTLHSALHNVPMVGQLLFGSNNQFKDLSSFGNDGKITKRGVVNQFPSSKL